MLHPDRPCPGSNAQDWPSISSYVDLSSIVPRSTTVPDSSICQIDRSSPDPGEATTQTPPAPSDTNGPMQHPGPGWTGSPIGSPDVASSSCAPSSVRYQTASPYTPGMYVDCGSGSSASGAPVTGSNRYHVVTSIAP